MIEAGFRPWIGPQYARPDNIFKRRILVLGESHYGPYGTEHPDDTINTVQLFTQGGARHAFFTKIAKVLLGLNETHWLSNKDLKEAFDRSEEHTSELQSRGHLVCRLLLEKNHSMSKRQSI